MSLVRMLRRRRLEISAALGASATICTALALHGSVPSFRHDWQWPASNATFVALAHLKVDAWWWEGFGSPSIAAQLHPFFVIPELAAGALGPYAMLALVCLLVWSASSGGMVALLRDRFGATDAAAIAGAAAYAFAPLVVVKMVAGHLAFLVAYAAIPLALWSAMAVEGGTVALLAASLAIASVQLQVFGLAVALVLMFRKLKLTSVALAVAAAFGTAVPHVWSLLRPGAAIITHGMITSRPWELSLSSHVLPALFGLGYFVPYWHQATASHLVIDRFLPAAYAVGIAGAACMERCSTRFRLSAVYATGVILVAGLHGPLSALLWFAFSRVTAFSAIRELYDMALLIVLAGSCGLAILVSRLPARAAWAVACATSVVAVLPWIDGRVLGETAPAPETAGLRATLDAISSESPWSRVVIFPPANPSGSLLDDSAGADPLALPYRSLLPLWVYLPSGFEPDYLWMLARRSMAIDSNLGISAALARTNFALKQLGPHVTSEPHAGYSDVSLIPRGARARSVNADLTMYRIDERAAIVQLVPARFPAIRASTVSVESERGADPRHTTAPLLDYWYLSKQLAEGAPSGAFTLARETAVTVRCAPAGRKVRIALLGTGLFGSTRVHAAAWRTADAYCGRGVAVRANPLVAVTTQTDVDNARDIERVIEARRLPMDRPAISGDTITASVRPCHACSLVLMEKFDPGWVMLLANADPVRPRDVGGFNEWDIDTAGERALRLHYEPADALALAVDFSLFAWSAIGLALVSAAARAFAPRK